MAVSDGLPVDAATTNAAFVSRLVDTSTIGIFALNHPSSGGTISNAQQQINTNATNIATNAANIASNDVDIANLQASVTFNNFTATTNPGASDDTGSGYEVGSLWVNVTENKAFIAVDVSTSAAIWKRLDKPMLKINSTYFNNDLTFDNVTWTELVADTGSDVIRQMQVFYTTGSVAQIGIGASSSETELFVLQSGGGTFDVEIPANSRIAIRVKSDEPDVTSAIKLAINFLIEA